MTAISADARVQRRGDLLANDLSPTETVMLDVAGGNYYGLRDVGKAIWDHLQSPMRVNELCDDSSWNSMSIRTPVVGRRTLSSRSSTNAADRCHAVVLAGRELSI